MCMHDIKYYIYAIYCVCSRVELICVQLFDIIKKKPKMNKKIENSAAAEKQHKSLLRQGKI